MWVVEREVNYCALSLQKTQCVVIPQYEFENKKDFIIFCCYSFPVYKIRCHLLLGTTNRKELKAAHNVLLIVYILFFKN